VRRRGDAGGAGVSFIDLLRLRYPVQSYALFSEVQSATAYQGRQRADAVAMGLWPSRGLDVIGFEFKRSRSDWLRELKQPDKAEEIFQFCDRWYLVVSDDKIVKSGELPTTWGLLVKNGKALKEFAPAPKLEAKPVSREFLASVLRSAQKDRDAAATAPRDEIYRQIMAETVEKHRAQLEEAAIRGREKYETLHRRVREFEKTSGINLNFNWTWENNKPIGAALALLDDRDGLRQVIDRAKGEIKHVLDKMEEAEKQLAGWPGFPNTMKPEGEPEQARLFEEEAP
jgi:hypothetical protein